MCRVSQITLTLLDGDTLALTSYLPVYLHIRSRGLGPPIAAPQQSFVCILLLAGFHVVYRRAASALRRVSPLHCRSSSDIGPPWGSKLNEARYEIWGSEPCSVQPTGANERAQPCSSLVVA